MSISLEYKKNESISLRDVFAKVAVEIGDNYPNVMMLDADLSKSTKTAAFYEKYNKRYFNIGIAEQNMVGIAAGLATMKYIPFVNTFASFLTRRACDQIAISVAYPNLNVKFFGFHGGINLGEDGATQQSVEDFAIMRGIPNIRVYSPIDANDLVMVNEEVLRHEGPTYTRLSRFPSPTLVDKQSTFSAFHEIFTGTDVSIFTTGTLTSKVILAAEALKQKGISVNLVAVTQIKPISKFLAEYIHKLNSPVAVVEEHSVIGGLADAISELLDKHGYSHSLTRIGIPDRFGESGAPEELLNAFGLAGKLLIDKLESLNK